MPKTRSEGARRTGAAIARVTTTAIAETAPTSATRRGNVDHRGENQHGAGNRPPADVAHVRREASVGGQGVQGEQTCRLREPENREPGDEALPANGGEGRDAKREIEADLERWEEGDRSLRIVKRGARLRCDHAGVERTEQADEQNAH